MTSSVSGEPVWKMIVRVATSVLVVAAGLTQIFGLVPLAPKQPWWASYGLVIFGFAMGHSTVFNIISSPVVRLWAVFRGKSWEQREADNKDDTMVRPPVTGPGRRRSDRKVKKKR